MFVNKCLPVGVITSICEVLFIGVMPTLIHMAYAAYATIRTQMIVHTICFTLLFILFYFNIIIIYSLEYCPILPVDHI